MHFFARGVNDPLHLDLASLRLTLPGLNTPMGINPLTRFTPSNSGIEEDRKRTEDRKKKT
jgi:hypothetical protein